MRIVLLAAVLAAPAAAQTGGAVLFPRPGLDAVADVRIVPMGDAGGPASMARAGGVLDLYGQPSRIAPDRDVVVGGRSVVGRWLALEVEGDRRATRDLETETLTKILVLNPGGRAILRGVDRRAGVAPEVFVGDVVQTRRGAALALDGLRGAAALDLRGRRLVLTDPRGQRTVFLRLVEPVAAPAFSADALAPAARD